MQTRPSDKTDRRIRFLAYAPIVVWTGVILFLGSGAGSMNETSLIIGPILRFLFPDADPATLTAYHAVIRKCAHLTEYGILAGLVWRAVPIPKRVSLRAFLIPVICVFAVAGIDEFNQSFNASRTSSIYDVMIDLAGGSVATAILILIAKTRRGATSAARVTER